MMDTASRFSSNLARTRMMIKETTMWMMNTMITTKMTTMMIKEMTTMMIKEMTRWMMIRWIMIKGMITRWMMTMWMINLSQSIPGSAGTGTGFGDAGGGAPPRKKSRPSIKRITIV